MNNENSEIKNRRYKVLFPDDSSKAKAFDKIAAEYYAGNFGRMLKSDFETMLFSIYIEQCLNFEVPYDDYLLSRELGITQSRIRSLKIKKELQYPYEKFDWEKAFIQYIPRARYDSVKRLVKIHIPDVNVLVELRNCMEQNGWYDEYQLNPKLFQCRVDIFLALCEKLGHEQQQELTQDAQLKLKELKKTCSSEKEKSALDSILSGSIEDGIKSIAISASKELLLEVLKLVPFGGLAGNAVSALADVIRKAN